MKFKFVLLAAGISLFLTGCTTSKETHRSTETHSTIVNQSYYYNSETKPKIVSVVPPLPEPEPIWIARPVCSPDEVIYETYGQVGIVVGPRY